MKVKVGILGLPNVGKSTLFNALAQRPIARAANFPFCTIDPNRALVAVPDPFLDQLGRFANSRVVKQATIEWVDVAGLAKGAHRGEGLGNQFLATLRECDALCHVNRAFDEAGSTIVHVDGAVDPVSDAEVINLELMLADLAHASRRLAKSASCVGQERQALETIKASLEKGTPARSISLSEESMLSIKSMGLLTLKPVLYVFNVDEADFCYNREETLEKAKKIMKSLQYCDPCIDLFTIVSAKLEAELSELPANDQRLYLEEMGVQVKEDQVLDDLLSYNILPLMAKKLLRLGAFYTGPGVPPERSRTTRAYLLDTAQQLTAKGLAGRLHGDIQKAFICAEVTSVSTLLKHENYAAAKQSGGVRIVGNDYVINDTDVILIKWKQTNKQ